MAAGQDVERHLRVPVPKYIGVRYLRDNMHSLIERLAMGEYFVILRHNHPVGALLPYDDLIRMMRMGHEHTSMPGTETDDKEAESGGDL